MLANLLKDKEVTQSNRKMLRIQRAEHVSNNGILCKIEKKEKYT